MNEQERRQRTRFDLKIPLFIRPLKAPRTEEHAGVTENISATGLFLASDLALEVGAPLEISLQMPERVTGKPLCEWCCRGRVVRVQCRDERHEKPGAAVAFQYYEVVARDVAWSES